MIKRFFIIGIIVCAITACNKQKPTAVRNENAPILTDTAPNIVKWKEKRKLNLMEAFLTIPDEYLKSSFSGIPTPTQRQEIINKQSKTFRDITLSEGNHYLFYSKDDGKQGMMTTLSTFLCRDSSEILGVEVSKWDDKHQETEQIHFLKPTSKGWEEQSHLLPDIKLQDFFRKDVSTLVSHADHQYLPVLCYELQKKGNRIKVFLGEFVEGNEKFQYKPDVEYIELEWNGERFEKLKL